MEPTEAFRESEIIIGLVAPVGSDLPAVFRDIESELGLYGYTTEEVKISLEVFGLMRKAHPNHGSEYERINESIRFGDEVCSRSGNRTLAQGAASVIGNRRIAASKSSHELHRRSTEELEVRTRTAYVVNQLKRPEEVDELRSIYGEGFYLLGVYTDDSDCLQKLIARGMTEDQALELKKKDAGEAFAYGQKTRDTFELADFFIHDSNPNARQNSIARILEIMFGHPFKTPTFDEYAMFTAFTAGLRSADLSRQVGAVVARNKEILGTGANECPRSGGGSYWPEVNSDTWDVYDAKKGRDYMRGVDSNAVEKAAIVSDVVEKLKESGILGDLTEEESERLKEAVESSSLRDITEYGRVVHAEMDALLSCARNGIVSRGATLYCTTFPCHNCAKHIIAAGIERVVYIEPYPKSKAPQFHDEAISLGISRPKSTDNTVGFEPFIGVGPRRFISLFSLRWGMGYPVRRKNKDGTRVLWEKRTACLRLQMQPSHYIKREIVAMNEFSSTLEGDFDVK